MSRSSSSASIALFPTPTTSTTSTTGGQLLWWENYHFCGWQTTFVPVCVTNQTMGPHSCAMHLWFSWIIYRLFNISISSRNCSHHVPCMVGCPPLSSSWNITKGTESHFFMFLVSSVFRFVDIYVFVIVFWFSLLRVCRNTSLSSLSFSCTLSFYYCFPNRTRWSKEHKKKKKTFDDSIRNANIITTDDDKRHQQQRHLNLTGKLQGSWKKQMLINYLLITRRYVQFGQNVEQIDRHTTQSRQTNGMASGVEWREWKQRAY